MLTVALLIVALFALVPASAAADGLPAVGVDASPVSNPGGQVEYQTEKAGKATRPSPRSCCWRRPRAASPTQSSAPPNR